MRHKTYKKVVLVILDGFGIAPAGRGNAISQAQVPTFDDIVANFPSATLQASGPLVGLPWGEMGNSEVGHLNIGAGRIVGQDLPRITISIQNREFFKNEAFLGAINHTKSNNSQLHLMGMVSSGGVHSLDEHMYALLGLAAEQGVARVFVHMFTDGRDTDERIALETLAKFRSRTAQIGVGEIATVAGRFYAMDRGGHWSQTDMAYRAMVEGVGEYANSAEECVEVNYANSVYDEMIKPAVILDGQKQPVGRVGDNDAVIFFNFRPDRALQLTQMFTKPETVPEEFRHQPLQNLYFATMTEYAPDLPVRVAFPVMNLKNNLAEVLSNTKMTQFHIAESEKYAHVTLFFNGGRGNQLPGEDRVIVKSPENGRNYVDQPEMSALELTDTLVQRITSTEINFFLANFANSDMVGHTGDLAASIKAVECLDACMAKIKDAALLADAALIVTADHGNVEQMLSSRTGNIDKDHTTNPVPFLFITNEHRFNVPSSLVFTSLSSLTPAGVVSDIAPTILDLFGLPKPPEMTGVNLLDNLDSGVKPIE